MHHAKTLLQHVDEAPTVTERNAGKQAVIKALLLYDEVYGAKNQHENKRKRSTKYAYDD
jgi:predicted branched-subunit amino acid permease